METQEIKQLKSVREQPVNFTKNAKNWLVKLINLMVDVNGIEESVTKTKQFLQDKQQIDKIIAALRGLHTHNIKIPNTKRNGQIYFPPSQNSVQMAGVCSETIKPIKYFGWAANAAESKAKLFLTTEFIYKDTITCLFLEFLKQESDLVSILRELGLTSDNEKKIRKACENVVKCPLPEHAEDPQVLWPIDDTCENYYAITPVPSIAMLREINLRTRTTEEDNFWYKTGKILIGGTQPINAGDFVNSVAGWLRLLKSDLPSPSSKGFGYLCKKVGARKTILNIQGLQEKHFDFMKLYQIIDSPLYKNKPGYWMKLVKSQEAWILIEELFETLFLDAIELHHLYKQTCEASIPAWVKKSLPAIEYFYITDQASIKLEEFAEYSIKELKPKLNEFLDKDKKKIFTPYHLDLLTQVAKHYLGGAHE